MKPAICALIALLGTLSAVAEPQPEAASAGERRAAGRVAEVVLYRDRARVARILEVTADTRETVEIVVDDLPRRIVPESLRVEADDDVVVSSVSHRVDQPAAGERAPRARQIHDRQSAIRVQLDMLAAQSEVLDGLSDFTGRALGADVERGLLQAGEVTELAGFAFEQRERLATRMEALSRESRRLDEERVDLEERERERADRETSRNVAVVQLGPRRAGPLRVRLSYVVEGVGWQPSYRAHAASTGQVVNLQYRASVRQASGEDWQGATLVLAPGPAPGQAHAPRLDALALKLTRSAPSDDGALRDLAARQLAELVSPHEPGRERAATGRYSARPIAVGTVNLASRPELRTLPLADLQLEGDFYRVGVPLAGAAVYREATVSNHMRDGLPAGPLLAYFDDAFVGEGRIEGVAPGEDFAIGFGQDPLLRASRQLLSREESLEGNRRRVVARYRLAVENRGVANVALRLFDRVPSTEADSGVHVSLDPPAVAPSASGDDQAVTSVLRWDVDVPAGAGIPWTLEYGLVVEFDRGFELVLDRNAGDVAGVEGGGKPRDSRWRYESPEILGQSKGSD